MDNFQSFRARLGLLLVLLLFLGFVDHGHCSESHKPPKRPFTIGFIETFEFEERDRDEFAEFCELGQLERQGTVFHADVQAAECSVTAPNEFDISIDGKMLFSLIMMVSYGALVRSVIAAFELTIPYTVVLMLSGLAVGWLAKLYCIELHEYTAIARVSSKIILFTFLPLLIFESAFSIPVHTFYRSAMQIIIVAFPGMVLCTFFTGGACMLYFQEYKWDFMKANLFGSIISATDPVAVVAILRELGVNEVLSVMIEGESLLNDGVAILLYEIFEEILIEEKSGIASSQSDRISAALLKFLQIAIGGPAFGWLMGKFTILLMGKVFNDPPVEISATIVAAYLTYWLSEDVLKVSGVMAVVQLGLTMRAERTVISPDSEEAVHHFWAILGYLANTILFSLVGIVITETALNDIGLDDYFNLLFLYVTIHVSRFAMLLLFYPILARIGYGLTWQNMIVMMWGGLRGAVGICLALEVYRSDHFCDDLLMGPKMLFQTCGIVVLTLVVNGMTTRPLLSALKLTEISSGRKEDMNNAVKRIAKIKGSAIRTFKLSSRMFDADWALVTEFCTIKNPYKDKKAKKHVDDKVKGGGGNEEDGELIVPPEPVQENTTVCNNCKALVPNEPTSEEYFHLTEEARLKVLRAMKVSFTHRNSVGLTSDTALQILMTDAERTEDRPRRLIYTSDFRKYTKNHGVYPWLEAKISKYERDHSKMTQAPKAAWRQPFHRIVSHSYFDSFMMAVVFLNMVFIIWELATNDDCGLRHDSFASVNAIFTGIFTIEFIFMITGHTAHDYFCNVWNYLDFVILVVSWVDTALTYAYPCTTRGLKGAKGAEFIRLAKLVRILRFARALRLIRPLLPRIQARIHRKINEQLFLGMDVARGFVYGSEEVLKFISQMIENKRILKEIKERMERERGEGLKAMAIMAQKYPGIAIALKTRYACRSVINSMSDSLRDAKDEGLLDETEADVLTRVLELKIKRLWHSPTSIDPDASQILLHNLSWLEHNDELYEIIMAAAERMSFGFGEFLCHQGEETSGIFVIVAGMIKISYNPSNELIELRNRYGKVPNCELSADLTYSNPESDYFTSGFVFGEYGVLTGDKWAADISAETSLTVYHISKDVMKSALEKYRDSFDSLEGQLWRSIGIRRAAGLLGQLPEYMMVPEQIPIHLERSTVPTNDNNVFQVPSYVSEIIVIEGYATNSDTNDTYIAPFLVPNTCRKLLLVNNPVTVNRLLIVVSDDLELEDEEGESDLKKNSKNKSSALYASPSGKKKVKIEASQTQIQSAAKNK